MYTFTKRVAALLAALVASAGPVLAVDIEMVTVGNPGNSPDYIPVPYEPDREVGAVSYTYKISRFEITAGQYTEFLNAVAADDTYSLYDEYMLTGAPGSYSNGCGISRSGGPGSYTYSVIPNYVNRPVNYVSWADAARFCNWLTNNQPVGPQDASTTEAGSYLLEGKITLNDGIQSVTRLPDARYVIPNANEWHKAAFHANDGITGNYWDYSTGNNMMPDNLITSTDGGNSVNYRPGGSGDFSLGPPYYTTIVGEFENSGSPYGTFDQGGNVMEWIEDLEWAESLGYYAHRGLRGGAFSFGEWYLDSAAHYGEPPSFQYEEYGFRIAEVPEPGTLAMLALGGLGLTWVRRRRSA